MRLIRFLALLALIPLFLGCSSFFRLVKYSPSARIVDSEYSAEVNSEYTFFYSDTLGNEYLRALRQNYGLDTLTANAKNQLEKVKIVLDWTSRQWEHSGSNQPTKSDAITILEEAKVGKKFRCVEYGIVSAAALNSLGIPARVVGLKTRDVERVKYGAGHVAAEVYLSDFGKWIFVDGQFNAIPVLNDVPLSAVEFKSAYQNSPEGLKIISLGKEASAAEKKYYLNFVVKYLYYMDIMFDQRAGRDIKVERINGKTKLMLVPVNAKRPSVFQRTNAINYCEYTTSLGDFYRKPA